MNKQLIIAIALVAVLGSVTIVVYTDDSNTIAAPVDENIGVVNETSGKEYAYLYPAFNEASDGDCLKLYNEQTPAKLELKDGRSITIDLNGNSISLASTRQGGIFIEDGSLALTGQGTVTKKGMNGGTINIEVSSTADPNEENIHLTIGKDVTVIGNIPVFIDKNADNTAYGVVVDVYGNLTAARNSVDKSVGSGIYVNGSISGSNGLVPVINIYDGAHISGGIDEAGESTGWGMYIAGLTNVNIMGGTITGQTGVEIRAGTITISGNPIITGTGEFGTNDNTNGSSVSGVAIAISQYSSDRQMSAVISGGTFQGTYGLYEWTAPSKPSSSVELSIIGGTFRSTDASNPDSGPVYSVNVESFISGGILEGFDSGTMSEYLSSDMKVENDRVVLQDASAVVAEIVDGQQFTSIQEAFKTAPSGSEIILLKEVIDCPQIKIDDGRSITLNLNGNNITFSQSSSGSYNLFYIDGGALSITGNGTVSEKDSAYYYAPVMLYGSPNADVLEYSSISIGPDVTLKGWAGIFINRTDSNNHGYGISVEFSGTIETGVDLYNDGGHGIYINGQIKDVADNAPIIRIHEGSSITSVGNGIYAAGYAHWIIDGGSITASDALSIKSGTFEISGGTFTSNGEFADPAVANGNGSENTGAAISITSNDGYAKAIEIDISGGTFISKNGHALYEGIAYNAAEGKYAAESSFATIGISDGTFTGAAGKAAVRITTAENKEVISGGTFSTDVSEYCTENMVTISEDGKFVTKAGHTVTFKSSDGTETVVRVPNGEAVESIPTQTATEAGYAYAWTVDDYAWDFDSPITYDVTLVETLTITDLNVDIEYGTDENGHVTFTAVPNSALELEYTYIWMYQGDESYTDTKQTITNQGVGGYSVTVTGKDVNEVMGHVSVVFTYRMLLPDQGEPSEEPEEFDITHSGQDVSRDVIGSTIAIVSSGNHTDVDLSLNFTEGMSKVAGIDINANVGGGALQIKVIKVDASEVAEENAPSGAIVEDAVAVDVSVDTRITDYSMIVKIPVQTKNGQYLRTVATYYTDDNGRTGEVQGRIVAVNEEYSEVWIYTDGNTQYTAVPLTYTDEPYSDPEPSVNPEPETPDQPVIDTDDETLPPIFIPGGSGTTGTSGDDDTVTIVACAAAAVVAALMAVFLILTYRKD